MAVTETHVEATPERCFEVLSEPSSFAYWVVGSREIRDHDPNWPAVGSSFEHTAGVWPLKTKDHTVVEQVEANRSLRLRARARPFGTAFVTVTMEREGEGTRLRLEEEPADRVSRLLFNPAANRILHVRNEVSIERLRKLAEGTEEIPPEGPRRRSSRLSAVGAGFGRGALAGLVGGMAMTVSTIAEMKLTGREASRVPAKAVKRLLGVRRLNPNAERRATSVAHFATSGLTGAAWGAIVAAGTGRRRGAPLLFAIASVPDVVVVPTLGLARPPWRWSPADMARTVLHHGVYALATYTAFSRLEE